MSGLIIESLSVLKNKNFLEFDGMWSSSLTDSATKGLPDNSSLSFSARISSLNDMMDVTTKPLIFDSDNGGQLEHLPYLIRSLERLGVSAIIMEDKVGLKKNSLFKNQSGTKQDKPEHFAKKIKIICKKYKVKFIINDDSFSKLLPNWQIDLSRVSEPLRSKLVKLGKTKLLYEYGAGRGDARRLTPPHSWDVQGEFPGL